MTQVFFKGSVGRIEGKYHPSLNKKAPVVLILHPHPLHGGTMDDKIIYTMYNNFVSNGFTTLRINFRGIGKSQGEFENGVGELIDAAIALDWLQLYNRMSTDIWVAGFSFGAWVAMQLMMRRPEVTNFVTISPPVNKYDFSFLSPCPVPGLIVQGNMDSIVPEEEVLDLVEKLSKQRHGKVDCRIINGADHFFRGKTEELKEVINEYLKYRLSAIETEQRHDLFLKDDDEESFEDYEDDEELYEDDEEEEEDQKTPASKIDKKPRRIVLDDFS